MRSVAFFILLLSNTLLAASKLLIPMDLSQTDHLKAYGAVYWTIKQGGKAEWLLNYRGGSFLCDYYEPLERLCRLRGVRSEPLDGSAAAAIYATIEGANMEVVLLEKAPRVAVYAPQGLDPWDDAVMLVLNYAEIPFDQLFDDEVLTGRLGEYDWLHLHHEDFTGQLGKFLGAYQNAAWYQQRKVEEEARAVKYGYPSVSALKKSVARDIKGYVTNGGFLFAMCSGTDTYDIALAAGSVDVVDQVFDGSPPETGFQKKLDFSQCLAFENFTLIPNPRVYKFSDIDMTEEAVARRTEANDYFSLFEFSAKYDPVPTMLTQNHTAVVKGFMGQTTSFRKSLVKKEIIVMGEYDGQDEVKYLHGNCGQGMFTFFGGHDPEDYRHLIGDPPTTLDLHRNSPGYRLILNNVLFPGARKKKLKT
ncbi:MAG: asparagine synthetase B [Calditrichaeota bacterium]|nr:asparagine synthetase B [Calditrichota bacterium]